MGFAGQIGRDEELRWTLRGLVWWMFSGLGNALGCLGGWGAQSKLWADLPPLFLFLPSLPPLPSVLH